MPLDRFDYNSAIATSANEQMLLNLVRLRYGEVPVFLAVNSVLTQYVWNGDIGVTGGGGDSLGFPAWNLGGSATARYIERPTVTYSPLVGQEFAAQLIAPMRPDLVFSLVSSGWPPDQLLVTTVQRFNDVENIGFAPPVGDAPEPAGDFSRVVALLVELAHRDGVELIRTAAPEGEVHYLEFAQTPDAETQRIIDELKDAAGLDHGLSRFRVTRRIVGRTRDEVTIRMHSLVELMGLLSAGVVRREEAEGAKSASAPSENAGLLAPLQVRCDQDRPADAFVTVRYGEHWYSIASEDETSKRAFGLLLYLFQMQASQTQGGGPLLTVPIG